MTDRIELRGLRVSGICGVLPEEQQRAQPLEVDVDIVADLTAASRSDDLADTADYDLALLERTLKGEGRLEWDLESGHLISLTFEGELEIMTEFAWEIEGPGGALPIEIAQEMSGTVEVRASYEVE